MNSHSNAQSALLTTLADAFRKIQDSRDPRGVRHDFQGMVILIFLGLLSRISSIAPIRRWAKNIGLPFVSPSDSSDGNHPLPSPFPEISHAFPLHNFKQPSPNFLTSSSLKKPTRLPKTVAFLREHKDDL